MVIATRTGLGGGAPAACPAQVRRPPALSGCLVLDRFPVLVCFVDEALTIRYANGRLGDVTGLTTDEIVGRPALDRVHAGDREQVRAQLVAAAGSPGTIWPATFRYRTSQGWRLASSQAVAYPESPWGAGILALIEGHDLDPDDELTAPALRGWEGALLFGPDGDVWVTGSAFREAAGLPRHTQRRTLLDLFPDPAPIHRALAGEHLVQELVTWPRADGQPALEIELRSTLPPGAAEDLVIVHVRNVTRERSLVRELGQALLAAQDLEEDRRLYLAWAAHELRSPLGAVVALGEVMQEGNLGNRDIGRLAGQIVENAHESLRIIDELLAGEQVDESHPRELAAEVGTCAREVAAAARDRVQPGVAVEVAVARPALRVPMAPTALRSVLSRLVENAIAHTPAGRIVVRVDGPGDGRVVVQVTDTGTGFDAAAPRRAGSHRTTHGLGMWVADTLVRRAGGSLEVESEPGAGTRASVTLPEHR